MGADSDGKDEERQDLFQLLKSKDAEIESLKGEVSQLRKTIDNLSAQVGELVSQLKSQAISDGPIGTVFSGMNHGQNADGNNTTIATPNAAKRKADTQRNTQTKISKYLNKNNGATTSSQTNESGVNDAESSNSNEMDFGDKNDDDDRIGTPHANVDDTISNEVDNGDIADNGTPHANSEWRFVTYKNKRDGKQKIPPIQIHFAKEGFIACRDVLTRSIGQNQFTLNPRADGLGARLFPATMQQHADVIKVLQSHFYEFHTFLTAEQKRKCFMIRGINSEFGISCEEVRDELVRAGFPDSTDVQPHITGRMRAQKSQSMFKVVVPASFDENIFKSVRSILGVGVQFERFVSGPVTQCSRCQFYFHTAAACHRPYRCVKCINNHKPGCCNKAAESEPQCVNCNGYHTANNHHNCEYFKKHIQPVIDKRKANPKGNGAAAPNNNSKTKNNRPIVNGTDSATGDSWAAKVKGNKASKNTQQVGSAQSIEVLCGLLAQIVEGQNQIINKMFNNVN